jgi:hypothetical protein
MSFLLTAFNMAGYIIGVYLDIPWGFILKAIGGILAMIYFWSDSWVFLLTLFYFVFDCAMIWKKRKVIFKRWKL